MDKLTFSPDGKWMWAGTEWIPSPPSDDILPDSAIDNKQISEVANEAGVSPSDLAQIAPFFDTNRDRVLQRNEIQQATSAIQHPNPTSHNYPQQTFNPPQQTFNPPQRNEYRPVQPGKNIPLREANDWDIRSDKKKRKTTFFVVLILAPLLIGAGGYWFIEEGVYLRYIDTDGDDVPDSFDEFPEDSSETYDSDGDGFGDHIDDFPNDPSENRDTDGDGFGDNADDCKTEMGSSTIDRKGCPDNDGDGRSNINDAFPDDASEWVDSDSDGYGDNADLLDSGDAYIRFDVESLQADSGQTYDFGSAPDMFLLVKVDKSCDGVYETTLTSSTKWDSHSVYSSDGMYVATDIPEDQSSICFSIQIYDEDSSEHDHLDYVTGQYSYISYTVNLFDGYSETIEEENNSSGESKSVNMEILVYIW